MKIEPTREAISDLTLELLDTLGDIALTEPVTMDHSHQFCVIKMNQIIYRAREVITKSASKINMCQSSTENE